MKNIFVALSIIAITLAGCYKDNSIYGDNPISKIEFVKDKSLEEEYTADKWDKFKLEPSIKQSIEGKELKYEWQIDYKVVSTEKNLLYTCDKIGNYECRLKVSNEDGALFQIFDLKVVSPYEIGLLLLSENQGKTMLSWKRTDKEDKPIEGNSYKLNNPNTELGSKPTLVHSHRDFVYIASSNPTKVVRINSKTFAVSNFIDFSGTELTNGLSEYSKYGVTMFGDGTIYDYETQQNTFMNTTSMWFEDGAVISDRAIRFNHGKVFFDNAHGNLMLYASYRIKNLAEGSFTGRSLVDMLACDNKENVLAIMKNTDDGKMSLVHYQTDIDEVLKDHDLTGTTVDEEGSFLTSTKNNLLLYTSQNKVYAYNYLANNFPTTPIITLEEGAVIKSIKYDEEEEKLFVAANLGNDQLQGAIYCYDIDTKEQKWVEKIQCGKIVQMIYKTY